MSVRPAISSLTGTPFARWKRQQHQRRIIDATRTLLSSDSIADTDDSAIDRLAALLPR